MIIGMLIMLCGTAFFGYLLGQFSDMIVAGDTESDQDKSAFELHNWTTMLRRFRNNNPLPTTLYLQINAHFKFFWSNNRVGDLMAEGDDFHRRMPGGIKRGIVIHYLFDDVFYNFREFFCHIPAKGKKFAPTPRDSKFLYEVAFGLKPRKFHAKNDEDLIYEEEEEVAEMYFITSGEVAVGFSTYLAGSA